MADPTQTNISQTTIPDYARPYVETLLGKTEAITSQNPYQAYPGQRTADFTPLSQQAFQGAQNLGPASQIGAATDLAGYAGAGALNTNYQPGQFGPQQFQNQVGGYMNPYLQMSLAPQIAEANRAYDISGNQARAQSVGAGAFGGSRQALMSAENERNRNMGLANIIGQGYNNAYGQAANQYQQGAQLGEQSRQFGAGLGLQGLQTALQSAGALGNLGATQFGQQAQTLGIQGQMGVQQQQQQQNVLNQQYQDFLAQKQYPYQQLSYMSDMLRGLPLSQTTQSVYSNPSMLAQVAGLGLTGAAVGNAFPTLFKADGGEIKEQRPAGLAELAIHQMG